MKNKDKTLNAINKIWDAIALLAGIGIIVTGVTMILSHSEWEDGLWGGGTIPQDATFGADFYTYIYNAARYAGAKIDDYGSAMGAAMSEFVKLFGGVLILFGVTQVCFFGKRITTFEKTEKKTEALLTAPYTFGSTTESTPTQDCTPARENENKQEDTGEEEKPADTQSEKVSE